MAEDDTQPKTDPKTINHSAQAPAANAADTKARADS
jgi:hypothetical protein